MKIFLNVPFKDKDSAKNLGARWDKDLKKWYIEREEDQDLTDFKAWIISDEQANIDQILQNPPDLNQVILVYADGASRGNPGVGGVGVLIKNYDQNDIEISEGFNNVTNNKMEITAVIKALKYIQSKPGTKNQSNQEKELLVRSDSEYVVNGASKWLKGWKENKWLNSKKEEVKNKDLWMELDQLQNQFRYVRYEWVKGHNGDPDNEKADALANQGCDSISAP